ncbi:hypothetical protein [Phyllobacterium sp. K27]
MIRPLTGLFGLCLFSGVAGADIAKSPFLCTPSSHEVFDVNLESVSSGDNKSGSTLIYADEEKAIICTKGASCAALRVSATGGNYLNNAMDIRYYAPITLPGDEEADLGSTETGEHTIAYTGTCKAVPTMDLKQVRRALK